MKLTELLDINNHINKKLSQYPKNSLSKHDVVYALPITDTKKAEQICSALNDEVTKTILNFQQKLLKDT